jgi:F-type H+-transporting ATPase subunit epsilon
LSIVHGFAEVLPDRVTILARLAERAEEIDVARAEAARKRAEARLSQNMPDEVDYERARLALAKSLMRLQVSSRGSVSLRTGASKRARSEG